jgi:hypothetical protein
MSQLHSIEAGCGTAAVFCVIGSGGLLQGVKQQVYETEHSPCSSAEVEDQELHFPSL